MTTEFQPISLQITTSQPRLLRQLHAAWPSAKKPSRAIKAIAAYINDALPGGYDGDISVFASNEAANIAQPVTQGFLYHLTQQKIVKRQQSAKRDALLYVHFETAEHVDEIEQDKKETIPVSRIEQIKEWQQETIKAVFQAMADTALNMEAQTSLRGALAGLNKLGALLNQTGKQQSKKTITRSIANTLSDLRSNLNIASTNGAKTPTKAQMAMRKQLGKLNKLIPAKEKTALKVTTKLKATPKLKAVTTIKRIVQKIALRQARNPRAIPIALTARHTARTTTRYHINRRAIIALRITPAIISRYVGSKTQAPIKQAATQPMRALPRNMREPRLYSVLMQPVLIRGLISPREALRTTQMMRPTLTTPQYRYDTIRIDSRMTQANVSSLPEVSVQPATRAITAPLITQETQPQPNAPALMPVEQKQPAQQQNDVAITAVNVVQPVQPVMAEVQKTPTDNVNAGAAPLIQQQQTVPQEIRVEKNDVPAVAQQTATLLEKNDIAEQQIEKTTTDAPAQQVQEKIAEKVSETAHTQIAQAPTETVQERLPEALPQQAIVSNIINLAEKRAERDAASDIHPNTLRTHAHIFTDDGWKWNSDKTTKQVFIAPVALETPREIKRPKVISRVATGLDREAHEMSWGTLNHASSNLNTKSRKIELPIAVSPIDRVVGGSPYYKPSNPDKGKGERKRKIVSRMPDGC